jgi:hypothetical protein
MLCDGRHRPNLSDLTRAFGARLLAAGVPMWRIYIGSHQTHPAFFGRGIMWDHDASTINKINIA